MGGGIGAEEAGIAEGVEPKARALVTGRARASVFAQHSRVLGSPDQIDPVFGEDLVGRDQVQPMSLALGHEHTVKRILVDARKLGGEVERLQIEGLSSDGPDRELARKPLSWFLRHV